MVNRTPKKPWSPKVTYHYVKPKNEAEAKEQKRVINKIYDDLFDAVWEEMKTKRNPDNNAKKG